MRVLIRFPLDTLHKTIVLPADPEAKYSPFSEKTTLVILLLWHSPLDDYFVFKYKVNLENLLEKTISCIKLYRKHRGTKVKKAL